MTWFNIIKTWPPIVHDEERVYKFKKMTGFSGKISAVYESKEDSIRLTKDQAQQLVPSKGLGNVYGEPNVQVDDDEKGTSYQEFKNAAEGTINSNTTGMYNIRYGDDEEDGE